MDLVHQTIFEKVNATIFTFFIEPKLLVFELKVIIVNQTKH